MSERLTAVRLMNDLGRVECEFRWYAAGEQIDPLDSRMVAERDCWLIVKRTPSLKSRRRAEVVAETRLESDPISAHLRPHSRQQAMEEIVRQELLSEQVRVNHERLMEYRENADGEIVTYLTLPNCPALRWEKVEDKLDHLAQAFPGQSYLEMPVAAFLRCFG